MDEPLIWLGAVVLLFLALEIYARRGGGPRGGGCGCGCAGSGV